MTHYYSLKKRLLLFISVSVLLISCIVMALAFKSAWHEIEEVYDAQLVHSAKVLLQLLEHELVEDADDESFKLQDENPNLQHKYEKNIAFRVWYKNILETQSSNAKSFGDLAAPPGFSDQQHNGESWRFFVFLETEHDIRIEVSERYAIRYELVEEILFALLWPMLLLIPAVFLVVWVTIKKNFQPIVAISNDVDSRNSGDLSIIHPYTLPEEVAPLVQAINRLLKRITHSFEREREFTDHAAHELRTPLAAMKTQTQVLQRETRVHPELDDDLSNLLGSINRADHLVNQLLLLARLQHNQFPQTTINLSEDIADLIATLMPESNAKTLTFSHHIAEAVIVQAHGDSIHIMLSNLLQNAIKYTPESGSIAVELSPQGMLTISDTGLGIRPEHKEKVFDRFFRESGTQQTGSGLGLSISKWIADAHEVSIALNDNSPQGLIVSIDFSSRVVDDPMA